MRSLIIIYGHNCPRFLRLRRLGSGDGRSNEQADGRARERVELQRSPEAADIFENGRVESAFMFFVFYLW